jgi:hypothetical protein
VRDPFSVIIFFLSFFASGLMWQPSPYLYTPGVVIDYIPQFFMVIPGTAFFMFTSSTLILYLVSAFILSILSLLTMEFVELVSVRRMKSHKAAFFLFLISVLWSFLPAVPLLFHLYVESVISIPFGPIVALFILPAIDYFKDPKRILPDDYSIYMKAPQINQ